MNNAWDLFDDPNPKKKDELSTNLIDKQNANVRFSEPQVHFKVVCFKFIHSYAKQSKFFLLNQNHFRFSSFPTNEVLFIFLFIYY
jgi:hypothetical protein